MRDFSGTIARLGNDPFTVKRFTTGEFVKGNYRRPEGADEEFPVTGSIQVMTPRELEMLSEAQRTRETRKLYTTCELKAGGVGSKIKDPDHVVFRGTEFEVQSIANWQHSGNYFKYLLVKAGQ